jgi:hypothetical protein
MVSFFDYRDTTRLLWKELNLDLQGGTTTTHLTKEI